MSRYLFALSSFLVLAAGCRHASVPTLPASHGHLALALDQYLDLPTRKPDWPRPADALEVVVVEPAQAPSVFAEAVQVLRGKPTEEEIHQAAEDLTAACEASFQSACDFLREQFTGAKKVAGDPPEYPQEALRLQAPAVAVLRCRLGVDGRLRACEVLEAAPYGFTEAMLKAVLAQRFQPAMLAGHPFEIPYTLAAILTPGVKPPPEQFLRWVRKRTAAFPKSVWAWFDLASTLAHQAPEDPAYVPALRHVNEIDPHYWWSANELAWMHVQSGRYAEAAPLARRARNEAPRNPYVLEVSAATLLGLGKCLDAVSMQREAVEGLPDEWPRPERERFLSTLREYTQRCAAGAPTTPVAPVR